MFLPIMILAGITFVLLECYWHRKQLKVWQAGICFAAWTLCLEATAFATANLMLAQFTTGETSRWFIVFASVAGAFALLALLPAGIVMWLLRRSLNWFPLICGSGVFAAVILVFLWAVSGIPQLNWW